MVRDGFSETERSPSEADVKVMLLEIEQILSGGLQENGRSPSFADDLGVGLTTIHANVGLISHGTAGKWLDVILML